MKQTNGKSHLEPITKRSLILITAFSLGWLLLVTICNAQTQSDGVKPEGAKKPARASFSNKSSKVDAQVKTLLSRYGTYAASDQGDADAILADSLRQFYSQTDAHYHEGEYRYIVNIAHVVVQGDPHNLEAYANTAWLLWSSDRNPEAIAFLEQGLAANPDNFYIYDELGAHYLAHMHDPVRALPYYQKAVTFKCPYSTWHGLALCYERTQQWDKALKAWESASVFPDDLLAPARIQRLRARLAKATPGG